ITSARSLTRTVFSWRKWPKRSVDRAANPFQTLQLATLHFDGQMEPRELRGKQSFKGKLFFARARDVVYSKIDVRNGAIGIVPDSMPLIAFSSEYPIYEVDQQHALPEYIQVLFRTNAFRGRINAMTSGTSGRTRVEPQAIESLRVPLPPLARQREIVKRWQGAQSQIKDTLVLARATVRKAEANFLSQLGFQNHAATSELPKVFAAHWAHTGSWSAATIFKKLTAPDIRAGKYPVACGREILLDVRHGCSAAPSPKETGTNILKVSAVTRGQFDRSERKFAPDQPRLRNAFDLKRGDVLMCRTNGTLAYVGMSALVREDQHDLIFPDKIIRVRVNQ